MHQPNFLGSDAFKQSLRPICFLRYGPSAANFDSFFKLRRHGYGKTRTTRERRCKWERCRRKGGSQHGELSGMFLAPHTCLAWLTKQFLQRILNFGNGFDWFLMGVSMLTAIGAGTVRSSIQSRSTHVHPSNHLEIGYAVDVRRLRKDRQ